jgi:hypothetical protein
VADRQADGQSSGFGQAAPFAASPTVMIQSPAAPGAGAAGAPGQEPSAERSWFAARQPSSAPRDREPRIDRDYRLDRDRNLGRDREPDRQPGQEPPAGQPELPKRSQQDRAPQAPPPAAQASVFEPTRLEHAAFTAEAPPMPPRWPETPPAPSFAASPRPSDSAPRPGAVDVEPPDQSGGISPVYLTGMQLVVPPGEEWTFRDPGTGAFPGYNPEDGYSPGSDHGPVGGYPPQPGYEPQAGYGQQPSYRPADEYGAPAGYPTQLADGEPPGEGGFGGHDTGAPYGPGGLGSEPAQRKRGRRAPALIGVGVLVVVAGIGAVVAVPKLLKNPDPGCSAYQATALPAYNHAVTDLNAKAPQATLNGDLASAVNQLTEAVNQARGASVKAPLQSLLTDLTQVQADVKRGSVPASAVSTLNTAAGAADHAC